MLDEPNVHSPGNPTLIAWPLTGETKPMNDTTDSRSRLLIGLGLAALMAATRGQFFAPLVHLTLVGVRSRSRTARVRPQ